jgi:hypothetical protein
MVAWLHKSEREHKEKNIGYGMLLPFTVYKIQVIY